MVALTEHNLNAVRDEAGKITAVQAVDKKGNPLSVTAKVPLMLEETDENGKTVSVQAVDKRADRVLSTSTLLTKKSWT